MAKKREMTRRSIITAAGAAAAGSLLSPRSLNASKRVALNKQQVREFVFDLYGDTFDNWAWTPASTHVNLLASLKQAAIEKRLTVIYVTWGGCASCGEGITATDNKFHRTLERFAEFHFPANPEIVPPADIGPRDMGPRPQAPVPVPGPKAESPRPPDDDDASVISASYSPQEPGNQPAVQPIRLDNGWLKLRVVEWRPTGYVTNEDGSSRLDENGESIPIKYLNTVWTGYKLLIAMTAGKRQRYCNGRLIESWPYPIHLRPHFPELLFIDGRHIDLAAVEELIQMDKDSQLFFPYYIGGEPSFPRVFDGTARKLPSGSWSGDFVDIEKVDPVVKRVMGSSAILRQMPGDDFYRDGVEKDEYFLEQEVWAALEQITNCFRQGV